MKKLMLEEHNGVGGLFFVTTNIICAFIMTISLQLSWMSQAVAMSDNLAYIVSINSTVHNYVGNIPAYDKTNPAIPVKSTGKTYNPLSDFNNMLSQAGIARKGSSTAKVVWTGKATYVQFSEFETVLGSKVRPHQQESIIENK